MAVKDLPTWFDATVADARRRGSTWQLACVLGPLAFHDVGVVGDMRSLNWPASAVTKRPVGNPRYSIAAVHQDPSMYALLPALPSAHVQGSTIRGRGAFPVRWWAPTEYGRPWVALDSDTGHAVVRNGSTVLIATRPEHNAARYVQRVLREVLIHGGRGDGFVLAHAAVIARHGRAILVTGNSGAGKTDLAVKLARELPAGLVTVDRCLLALRGGRILASSLPFGLNIHRGTLADLGCLTRDIAHRFPAQGGKHYLDVDDFQRRCGITLTAQADVVGCVALSTPSGDEQVAAMPDSGLPAVFSQVITAGKDPGFALDWLGLGPATEYPPHDLREWAAAMAGAGMSVSYRPGSKATLTRLKAWLADRL